MKSLRGVTPKGESMKPGDLPEEPDETAGEPKAAPAPGLPISEDEYRRLKKVAEHGRGPRVEEAQEDHPKGKGKARNQLTQPQNSAKKEKNNGEEKDTHQRDGGAKQ